MRPRKSTFAFHVAFLAVVTTCGSALATPPAPPAPRAPAHAAAPAPAPDKKPVVTPAAPTRLQRFAAFLGLGKAPASKPLPTHLDLKSDGSKPAAPEVAPRTMVFGGGTVDDAVDKLISNANATGIPHKAELNGQEVIAHPGDDRAKVRKPFDDALAKRVKAAEAQKIEADKVRAAKLAALGKPLVHTPPKGMKLDPRGKWGDSLSLITPAQLDELPVGTVLRSPFGPDVIVGVDYIDRDTRGGFVAFGFDPRVTP